jgi:nucleotide-binding universal stress UspA family protein
VSAYRRILVAVDGSPASDKGLREALRLAKSERAGLVLLHVVDTFPAYASVMPMAAGPGVDLVPLLREAGRRVLARAQAVAVRTGLKPKLVMRETLGGPAADRIVREARRLGADLIVLGTHGRRGVRRLVLGSDAEQVVRNAAVPVLLVRGGSAR